MCDNNDGENLVAFVKCHLQPCIISVDLKPVLASLVDL
jgi:hypothetical protein